MSSAEAEMEKRHFCRGNIHADPPDADSQEAYDAFLTLPPGRVTLERIFSEGQASPNGFWYDQAWDEWVMIITGGAVMELQEIEEDMFLMPGDWVFLPAHCRHRVKSTTKRTLWLAVHVGEKK